MVHVGNENRFVPKQNLYFCVIYGTFAHGEMDGFSSVTKSISQKSCFPTCFLTQSVIIIDSVSHRNRGVVNCVFEKGETAKAYGVCIFVVFY
jgi:hypothetical protein